MGAVRCAMPMMTPESVRLVTASSDGIVAGSIAPLLDHSLVGLALGMAAFTLASLALWVIYLGRTRVVPP